MAYRFVMCFLWVVDNGYFYEFDLWRFWDFIYFYIWVVGGLITWCLSSHKGGLDGSLGCRGLFAR